MLPSSDRRELGREQALPLRRQELKGARRAYFYICVPRGTHGDILLCCSTAVADKNSFPLSTVLFSSPKGKIMTSPKFADKWLSAKSLFLRRLCCSNRTSQCPLLTWRLVSALNLPSDQHSAVTKGPSLPSPGLKSLVAPRSIFSTVGNSKCKRHWEMLCCVGIHMLNQIVDVLTRRWSG